MDLENKYPEEMSYFSQDNLNSCLCSLLSEKNAASVFAEFLGKGLKVGSVCYEIIPDKGGPYPTEIYTKDFTWNYHEKKEENDEFQEAWKDLTSGTYDCIAIQIG